MSVILLFYDFFYFGKFIWHSAEGKQFVET